MSDATNIGDFIREQEAAFQAQIEIKGFGSWNFPKHVEVSSRYKHGQLAERQKGQFDLVKNITKPILNLQYRAEGFDVKDIVVFIEDSKKYFKSLLVKVYFAVWARQNKIDTIIDEMVESYVDYGGSLLKNHNDGRPEVVQLSTIAFGDQRDLLAHPFGIKHDLSPAELLDMAEVGWGDKSKGADTTLEQLILTANNEKRDQSVSGIPIYECHGRFPKHFYDKGESMEKFESYLFIISYYTKENNEKSFVTLYKGKEKKLPFKMVKRDPIPGRALGFGGAEEIFDNQVGTNADVMRKEDMKDSASKTLVGVKGPNSATIIQQNSHKDMENNEMLDLGVGGEMGVIDTFPRNIKIFDDSENDWEMHAQKLSAAQEAIMGEEPKSGTPLGSVQIQQMENHSLHEYRKGKLATFWDEVMQDWIVPHIARAISKEQEFLAELDFDDLKYVQDSLITCETNKFLNEKVLNGELIRQEEVEGYKEVVRTQFKKKGNKHFFKILAGEMKDAPITVRTNIVGKQKNLGQTVDKINSIVLMVLKAGGPAALAAPATWDLINQVIEKSGLDPVDFSELAQTFQKLQQATQTPTPQGIPPQMAEAMPQMQPSY